MGALPDWCEPLLDAEAMRAVDRWAIEQQGIPSLQLMERAGEQVAAAVERLGPDGPVAVVCGKGNNGGDGLVAARLLRERARAVSVLCACDPGELSGDARVNLERLPGERPARFGGGAEVAAEGRTGGTAAGETAAGGATVGGAATAALDRAAVIVDALLGTGFQGEPHGVVADAIDAINRAEAPVVSVDVPSGVDASSGEVAQRAVLAATTVTFHLAKPGLWIAPGKSHVGEVVAVDIGIPRGAPGQATVGLIGDRVLEALPSRTARSTKFTSGHVVVAGGSAGLMGAPAMAALAAMRAGAGYVTACVPASQAGIVDAQLMEVMTRSLPEAGGDPGLVGEGQTQGGLTTLGSGGLAQGALSPAGVDEALEALARAGALALGPGLGRSQDAFAFAKELAQRANVPTLIDADGLKAHAGLLDELASRQAPTVLTPHAGELGRLLEVDAEEVERGRLTHVRAAASAAQAVVVLKGDDTLIAAPDGQVLVSRGGCPALATAGTGDVLSGAISALLAQRLDPLTAAAAGVALHAAAAREAARRQGSAEGVIASDVIAALPAVRSGERREGLRR